MAYPTTIRSKELISSERTLADVRLILSLASVVIGARLVTERFAFAETLYPILGGLAVYSLVIRLVVAFRPKEAQFCGVLSSFVDVGLITVLNAVTETSPTAQNPFYLWYVFYVVSVSVRYGLYHAILALSASVVLYTATAYAPGKMPQPPLPGFLARTGFLFILAFLFGHMSERHLNYQARIAVVHNLGLGLTELSSASDMIDRLLKETSLVLSVERCWFVPWGPGRRADWFPPRRISATLSVLARPDP